MQRQRATRNRMRCQRHGLVVTNDGACPTALAEKHPASRGRVVRVTLLIAIAAAAVVLAVHWQLGRFRSEAESEPNDRSAGLPDGRVSLARSVPTTAAVAAHDTIAVDHLETAEDSHLGKPLLQPRTLGLAPPAPPRASVDLEPQAPEDPRDFNLPAQPSSGSRP